MSAIRKMTLWLDDVGRITPFHINDASEGDTDPDGSAVPRIPGTQRMHADGGWYYVIPPQNLATLIQAGSMIPPQPGTPQQAPGQPPQASHGPVSFHPMAMMQQMMQSAMMSQMMQSMGISLGDNQQSKAPLDLSQLTEPAAIFGEKIKEGILGAVQIWRAVKGT